MTKKYTNRSWMRRSFPEHVESKEVMKMIVECKPQDHSSCMLQIKPSRNTAETHTMPALSRGSRSARSRPAVLRTRRVYKARFPGGTLGVIPNQMRYPSDRNDESDPLIILMKSTS